MINALNPAPISFRLAGGAQPLIVLQLDGILGYNFLRLYRVIIDYPRGRKILEQRKARFSLTTPRTVWLAGAKMRYTFS